MKGRRLMITGGLCLMLAGLLCGYNLWDSARAGSAAREALSAMQTEQAVRLPELNAWTDTDREMPLMEIDGRMYLGSLEISALDINLPVLAEWSEANAKIAPCRYTGSVYEDNLIIAGHNYRSHFGPLGFLEPGDEVILYLSDGTRYAYAVSELETVAGTGLDDMQAGEWDLTLFTCTYGGQNRVTVRCVSQSER